MAYFSVQIANEFIRRGKEDGTSIDPLKIQKLVYLAHGWHLAFLGTPLIKEGVQAWRYGPVVPLLYREFRSYGVSPIDSELPVPSSAAPLDESSREVINEVWKTYGKRSGLELSMLTHESGSAWDIIRRVNDNDWNSPIIPDSLIKEEFERRKG